MVTRTLCSGSDAHKEIPKRFYLYTPLIYVQFGVPATYNAKSFDISERKITVKIIIRIF